MIWSQFVVNKLLLSGSAFTLPVWHWFGQWGMVSVFLVSEAIVFGAFFVQRHKESSNV